MAFQLKLSGRCVSSSSCHYSFERRYCIVLKKGVRTYQEGGMFGKTQVVLKLVIGTVASPELYYKEMERV